MRFTSSAGRVTITTYTLKMLIHAAYDVDDLLIQGGPSWIDSDRYDIRAVMDGTSNQAQQTQMLRNLLEDRFRLKVHQASKEGLVYTLTLGKNGHKLKPTEGDPEAKSVLRSGELDAKGKRIEWLAGHLTRFLKSPVLDQTGMTGVYDFKLQWYDDVEGDPEYPSLFTAIHEQLGLKLTAAKGPVQVLVVDRLERPSEN